MKKDFPPLNIEIPETENGRPWNGKTALEDGLLGMVCNSRKDLSKPALRVAVVPFPGSPWKGP